MKTSRGRGAIAAPFVVLADEWSNFVYWVNTTRLEIILSDDIERKAAVAGLLWQDELEEMLRTRLGIEFDNRELTPEDFAEEIRSMRTETRMGFDRLLDKPLLGVSSVGTVGSFALQRRWRL